MPAPGDPITPSLRLVRPLGAGGMGHVWVAWHEGLRTEVVVKMIHGDLATNKEAIARFSREASAAAQVRSPHVVQTFDHGVTATGQPYIAMELLEGESLRQRLDRVHALAPDEVTSIITQCSRALGKAHERGVVHRDIKPDNIFLCDAGAGSEPFVKVLDFGIAKANDGALGATATGAMLGTPYYMSPEQVLGSKSIDARTDVWALGVVAYEALTGRRPFEAETVGALSIAICHAPMPVPSAVQPEVPRAFDAWFARACARNLDERYPDVRSAADGLGAALSGALAATVLAPGNVRSSAQPLSTTAGLGVASTPPKTASMRQLVVLLAIIVGGGIVGIVAWKLSQPSTAATTAPTEGGTSAGKEVAEPPKLAKPVETSALPTASAPSGEPPPKPAKPTATSAPKATKPSASMAPGEPTTSPPPPKPKPTEGDPNIF